MSHAPLPNDDEGRERPLSSVPLFSTPPPARPGVSRRLLAPNDPLPEPSIPAPPDQGGEGVEVDWKVVGVLRQRASEQIAAATRADEVASDRATQRQRGLAIVVDLVGAANADRVDAGLAAWSAGEQSALVKAVMDQLFGLGRLQPLVDRDDIENIEIDGCDNVRLQRLDGSYEKGPSVAGSNEELIDLLQMLASQGDGNARAFSPAQPNLDLTLPGGARLSAAAWVSTRPQINIRLHRLVVVTLEDLVEAGEITENLASFLRAVIRARLNVVITGAQGAGKTTLARAMCAEIPYSEAIGTFETEYELMLHTMPDQHAMVRHYEARPGTGEIGPDGRPAGEYGLARLIYNSFRQNLSRQIVGEVRGAEVWAMVTAMESGTGSISTTHASSAQAAVAKLVTCAMEAGIAPQLATRKLAATIDLIVHIDLDTPTTRAVGSPRPRRRVTEVLAVTPGEDAKGYATEHVYLADPDDDGPARPHVLPHEYRRLTRFGFDLDGFLRDQDGRVA